VEIIAGITNIVFAVILIPRFGIAGAAAATGLSYMTRNFTSVSFVYIKFRIHPYRKSYLSIMLSGIVSAVLVYFIKMHSPLPWLPTMLILGALFLVMYFSATLLSRSLDEDDRVVIDAVEKKTGVNFGFLRRFM
jgi:O-antigen/teichoic acid export membrane protein